MCDLVTCLVFIFWGLTTLGFMLWVGNYIEKMIPVWLEMMKRETNE